MSLKPDRHIFQTEINLTFNGTATAGSMMVYSTAGSGTLTDDARAGVVTTGPNDPSGQLPAGLLVHPFVAFDPLLHRNVYKVTQYPGEKATLLRQGWVVLDNLAAGASPDAGKAAYLGVSGTVTTVNAAGAPRVGEFMGKKDENGFVRLSVRLPQ